MKNITKEELDVLIAKAYEEVCPDARNQLIEAMNNLDNDEARLNPLYGYTIAIVLAQNNAIDIMKRTLCELLELS